MTDERCNRRAAMLATGLVLTTLAGAISLNVATAPVRAQAPVRPSFEVASVKQNKSGEGFIRFAATPGGFRVTNATLRELIRFAYQLQPFQIEGGPGWITSDRFDIVAKAEGNLPPAQLGGPPGPLQLMMQSLLAERFKLVAHNETKQLPIYAMIVARSDGRLGPNLRRSDTDCAVVMAGRRGGVPQALPQPGERPMCGMRIGPGSFAGGGMPLSQVASALSPLVQRIVVDKTGLMGVYDVDITYTPDQLPQGPGGPLPPGITPPPPIDPNGPSIFTALQEQLGLKLDSQRGPVDVFMIDSVDHPSED